MRIDFQKSVRKIGKNYTSVTGKINSLKNNKLIQYESTLERDFIYLLEFDANVEQYVEQPITLEYKKDYFTGTYTPDFYVKFNNHEMPHLIEVKPWESLKKNWFQDNYRFKFEEARQICEKKGWKFVVLTESHIRSTYLDNVKFLLKFINHEIDFTHLSAIEGYIKDNGPISINDLKYSLSSIPKRQAEYLFSIWIMLAREYIYTDLHVKLTMNSILTASND